MRLRIGTKITLGFAGMGAIFFLFALYSTLNVRDIHRQLISVQEEVYPSLDLTNQLVHILQQTEEAYAKAIEDVDAEALVETIELSKDFHAKAENLMALTSDPEVEKSRGLYSQYTQLGQKTISGYLKHHDLDAVRDKLTRLNSMASALNQKLERFHNWRYQLFRFRLNMVRRSGNLVSRGIFMAAGIGLGVGILVAMVITRGTARPISLLASAAQQIGGGRTGVRVQFSSKDELGDLANTINTMAENLEKTTVSRDLLVQENAERKRAEESLRAAYKNLERTHGQLKHAQDQLVQAEKFKSLGYLAAGVAHEVKNPLSIILMGTVILSNRVQKDDPLIAETLQGIEQAARRADSVIKGILDFASVKKIEAAPNNLNAIIDESLSFVKLDLDRAHIRVIRDFAQDLPVLQLDRTRIQQVFINLFSNAIHAMPQSGKLTVQTYLKNLGELGPGVGRRQGDCFRPGERVVVAVVEDTGTGISGGLVEKVFDPFFTTKQTGKGTGLGLSVTKNIVDMHKGLLQIANKKDRGVRASILFKI